MGAQSETRDGCSGTGRCSGTGARCRARPRARAADDLMPREAAIGGVYCGIEVPTPTPPDERGESWREKVPLTFGEEGERGHEAQGRGRQGGG